MNRSHRSIAEPINEVSLPDDSCMQPLVGSVVERRRGKQTRGSGDRIAVHREAGERTSRKRFEIRQVRVATGPLHTSISPVTQAHVLPHDRLPESFPLIRVNGDALRLLLAYEFEQEPLPNSLDNRLGSIRQDSPAGSSFVVGPVHASEGMNRSRQCLSETIREEIVA